MQKITRIVALLLVVIAVLLALLAFGLGRRAIKPADTPVAVNATAAPDPKATLTTESSMVVAADTLPAGQPISPSSLQVVGSAQRPPASYASVDAVAGEVPLVDVPKGAAITAGLLAHGVALALRPGERALAVPVDELAGAGHRIFPGDYVDVFLSLKDTQPAGMNTSKEDQTQTRLLLSRLRVLAYGEQDLPAAPPSASKQANSPRPDQASTKSASNGPQPPRTAVLAVPVAEVDRLLLGAQNGKLALALRHPSDDGQPNDTLFTQPSSVLAPLTSLTSEQQQLLASPENHAYAGIDGPGLSGRSIGTVRSGTLHRRSTAQGVEIIRGTPSNAASATGNHPL
ncbi:Flp pilus assembly protein CpaB [Dyella tabacisoli]|uniref:Flp pilus assembly protein CpaB n=1 Tax=Dyella tabacisoli TaxID=2282381 RepID=A0A369UNY3_9GAMM|nr:Flp pilus assembly protein CpaB [Dyella tabacisoli]RDD81330.1 Flp pilus assembly protein CpaB [Dyella tabacisoli]